MRPIPRLKLEKPADAHGASSLIAAAPLEALLKTLSDDIARIRARMPQSQDLATLEGFRDELTRALAEARRANVWVRVKDIKQLTGRAISTITRDCRDVGEPAGCIRVKGVWEIHWPTYEAWMRTHGERPEKAA